MENCECIKKVEFLVWNIYSASITKLLNTVLYKDRLTKDNISNVISDVYKNRNFITFFIEDEFPTVVNQCNRAESLIDQIIDALKKDDIEDIKEFILGTSLKEMAYREEIDPTIGKTITIIPLAENRIPILKKFLESYNEIKS